MAIDLKVQSNYAGKTVNTTVSNISPAATNAQLTQLGRKLIGFSDAAYEKGSRVETINVDTTPGGGIKPEPTLTLAKTTFAKSEIASRQLVVITTNSDGNLYFRPTLQGGPVYSVLGSFYNESGTKYFMIQAIDSTQTVAQTVYVGVTETDNYAAKEVAVTITA